MSSNIREKLRTQGRYDEKSKEQKREVKRTTGKCKSSKKGPSQASSQNPNSSSLVYSDTSSEKNPFPQLTTRLKPKIIRERGFTTISNTENGESRVFFEPHFYTRDKSAELFKSLNEKTEWYDKKIVINGEEHDQPRQVSWFGPLPYSYSGVKLEPKEFTDLLLEIKRDVEHLLKKEGIDVEFNSVLLNLYRNGKDSVAWHSDDESSMGVCPTIASVSLGEIRRFEMKRKFIAENENEYADAEYLAHLTNGSLIVMDGVMQKDWLHRVPKEYHDKDRRINLTFRTVFSEERGSSYRFPSQRVPFTPAFTPPAPKNNQEPFKIEEDDFPELSPSPAKSKSRLSNRSSFGQSKKDANNDNKDEEVASHAADTDDNLNATPEKNVSHPIPDNESHWISSSEENFNSEEGFAKSSSSNVQSSKEETELSGPDAIDTLSEEVAENVPEEVSGNVPEEVSENVPEEVSENVPEEVSENVPEDNPIGVDNQVKMPSDKKDLFQSLPPLEFNQEYCEEGKRLSEIYYYIQSNWNLLPLNYRDKKELKVLSTVIDFSGPLRLKVMRALADRMHEIVYMADKRQYDDPSQFARRGRRGYYN